MLATTRRLRRLGITVAVAAAGFPATAHGAEIPGPRVIRIDASTGAQTVLAGGDPWTSLTGIAVGPAGAVYVSDFGPSDAASAPGGGIFSLTAPGFAKTPLATTSPIAAPGSLVASGSTLYVSGSAGVFAIDTDPPFTQKLLVPERVGGVALAGSTLYATSSPDCGAGRNAKVLAIDPVTGSARQVGDLGCLDPGAIVAAPNGTLLIARWDVNGPSTGIVRFNPVTGAVTPVATGGKLRAPTGIAVTASGDLIVADRTSGVLRISGPTGKQTTIASGGDLTQASAVALDPSGNIYVTASGTVTLKATAKRRQRLSASGIRVSATCRPRCALAYRVVFPGASFSGTSFKLIDRPASKWSLRVKVDAETRRLIAKTLRRKRSVRARVILAPVDGNHQSIAEDVNVTVDLVR